MYKFTGEYECKIDAKGRVRIPSSLVQQIPKIDLGFVLNRGFEKHLILYPKEVWDTKTTEIDRLNIYNKTHRQAIRYFYRGATEVSLDANDRLLIPKPLSDYAEIGNELVLFAYQDRIEFWAKEKYEEMISEEPDDFSDIANSIFGALGERGE
jgi:MraZ protein